jgi:hypothetical protein
VETIGIGIPGRIQPIMRAMFAKVLDAAADPAGFE